MIVPPVQLEFQNNMPIKLENIGKQELLTYFRNSWKLYEWLFSAIKADETYYLAPDPLRNPLIFYLGHTAAFYINKMQLVGLLDKGIHPHFDELFAKGVDPNLPEHLEVHDLWPSMEDVRAYRVTIKKIVEDCISRFEYKTPVDKAHPLWAILMGIEHDRIHFETSSMLIRQLPIELLQRPIHWKYAPSNGEAPINRMIPVEKGVCSIGKHENSKLFGWDNEYGHLEKSVAAFEASQNLISNQEYIAFYKSGGYQDQQNWSAEGWAWKERTQTQHPKFWVKKEDAFVYRAMFDELPMPLDYPVEVNAHEAWAYCNWKGEGYRLLSEAEFHIIAHNDIKEKDCAFESSYNLNMKHGSPSPVLGTNEASSALGFNDLFGNVWDWLSDDFYPLPGFERHDLYKDFSEPYFDEEHSMLLGGAWATTGTGASKYYRLWFRRHFYQHAGFRIARSL